jgi:myo-inositol-1(or 4)-monophosphatase
VTDWLAICRRAVEDVEAVLREMPDPADRARVVGQGEGGDETSAIDEAAERVVVARLDAEAGDFTLVSEELGIRPAARGATTYVVVDPIDGSINAKRAIPFFSVSIAVADGPTMGQVRFGYVYDFGSREEWVGRRGEGAQLNGAPFLASPHDRIELLAMEATKTELIARYAGALVPVARRVRVMGSLALALCHVAAGRLDAVCSLKAGGARAVDIAAGQLIVSEVGGVVDLIDDGPIAAAPLDLDGRSRVVAAGTAEHYHQVVTALGPL